MVDNLPGHKQKDKEDLQKDLQVARKDRANCLNEMDNLKRDTSMYFERASALESDNNALLQEKQKNHAASEVSVKMKLLLLR